MRSPMSPISPSRCRPWALGRPGGWGLAVALGLTAPALSAQEEDRSGAVPSGGSGAVIKRPGEEPPDPKKAVVVPPKLLRFQEAPYPKEAQDQGLQGSVVLTLTIDATGKVTAAEVKERAGHGFDEAARDAALQFVFEPATRDGKPIPVKILYRYDFTLRVAAPPADAPPPPPPTVGNLSGTLKIAGVDAPLAGAEVQVTLPDGTSRKVLADAQGRWSLEGVPPGKYRVRVSAPGYEATTEDELVAAGEATEVVYRVVPEAEGLEIDVVGEKPPREVTRRTLERREISRIPGTGGDALRSIQSLPGVARPPGLAGLLIVRGSAPQDSLAFIDGTGVPLIYHFGGLSSVVPTELLDQIDFYPGNFGVRYGRLMGGIVDVKLRPPNTECRGDYGRSVEAPANDCYHGLAQLDLIDGRLMLEGPITDGWSFLVAGRRSWIDAWITPVLEEAGAGVTSAPVYYDYQAIVEAKPSAKSRFSLRAYGSDDRFEILIEDPAAQEPAFGGNLTFGTSFVRVQGLYETELSRDVSLTTMVATGKSSLGFSLGTFKFEVDVYPVELHSEFALRAGEGVTLNAGYELQVAPFDVFVRAPQPPRPGEPDPGPFVTRPPLETQVSDTAFRPAWYMDAEITPMYGLRLVPGFRVDYARDSGQTDFSPRVVARYDLVSPYAEGDTEAEAYAGGRRRLRTTVKGGAGMFHQPPQFQETDTVFGTPGLRSNRAMHYSLGVEQELTRWIDLSVEGFYKDLTNLVSRQESLSGGFQYGNDGQGYTMGLETLLKYKPDSRFFGWLAYTLSRSVRRDSPGEEEYLIQFDQTHNLTVLGSYRLGRGWEFGARFRVISGSLDTPVLSPPALPALFAADAGAYVPLQGEPFSRRLPLFHQLDLRVDKRWQFRQWALSAYLDVQNAYNNAAVESLLYSYDFSQSTVQTGLPILPSIGVRGEF